MRNLASTRSVPTESAWFFNGKVGYEEDMLSPGAPGLQLGFYMCGTQVGDTNYDVVYLVTGKTFGKTQLAAAYWVGNGTALHDSQGRLHGRGYMASVEYKVSDQLTCVGDYESGRNALGGGGVGVSYNLTKQCNLVTGPVWFTDRGLNGGMKWTTQLTWTFSAENLGAAAFGEKGER